MQKSTLVEIIGSLSRKEIRDLNKWLQSPAHNQRQDVIRLFEYICKHLDNGETGLEKEKPGNIFFTANHTMTLLCAR